MPKENWSRYPLQHSDSLDPRRVMEITIEVARLGESLSRRHTRYEEKFLAGTPTSSSALAPHSDDTEETPRNPVRQNARPILALAGFKRLISN
jgi:hypothetical protein